MRRKKINTIHTLRADKGLTDPPLDFPPLYVNWSTESADGVLHALDGLSILQGKVGVDTDEFDRHLVIHEWGHYFENYLSRSNSMGVSWMGDTKDISLAFGEGFATGLGGHGF